MNSPASIRPVSGLAWSARRAARVLCAVFSFGAGVAVAQPILVINDASIVEGHSGSTILKLAVNFSGAQPNTVTGVITATPLSGAFNYKPATGGAMCGTAGVDYEEITTPNFSIPPNTPNGTLSVNLRICGDTLTEPDEHVFVALTQVVGAQCPEGSCDAVAKIVNDDALPTLSIGSLTTSEPSLGTRTVNFTVNMNRPSASNVNVSFVSRNGTAKATCGLCSPAILAGDYVGRSGSLQIPAGSLSATIGITINSDGVRESDEDFFIDLSAPVNATVATATGRGVIRNIAPITGGFELSPPEAATDIGQMVLYQVDWTVPSNQVWRNLRSIDLRLRGAEDTAMWIRWDEASNEFSLCTRASNATGLPSEDGGGLPQQAASCGPGSLPGSQDILATPLGLLHMAHTAVQGSGPTGQLVTLVLGVTPIGDTAGHTYKVELSAGDDFGTSDRFERAGELTVRRR